MYRTHWSLGVLIIVLSLVVLPFPGVLAQDSSSPNETISLFLPITQGAATADIAGDPFDLIADAARAQYRQQAGALQASAGHIVADGLNNPRGLGFGPDNALYVAESGTGGPCSGEPEICAGRSGSITRLWRGAQDRYVTGLPSISEDDSGVFALGPTDVSYRGRAGSAILGLGSDPAVRDLLAQGDPLFSELGYLARIPASGKQQLIVDVAAYESAENPDGGHLDSNPYSVLSIPGGHVVADAGANAVLEIKSNGNVSALATFPNRDVVDVFFGPWSIESVPTSLAEGPDGAIYVGELTGFPFTAGEARVYRLSPGGPPQVFEDGFTMIIDIAFGPDGSLYVLQFADDPLSCLIFEIAACESSLIRVYPDGTRTVVASTLAYPGGVAVNGMGDIYVTENSVFPGIGRVISIH